MKDLHLNRMIHVAATSALVLTVVSCGGKKDKDEEDPVPEKEDALTEFCVAAQQCEEAEFESEYEDLDACIEDGSMNHTDLAREQGEECGDSVLRLLDCLGKEWPETCDLYYAAYDCVSEALGVNSDCEDFSL